MLAVEVGFSVFKNLEQNLLGVADESVSDERPDENVVQVEHIVDEVNQVPGLLLLDFKPFAGEEGVENLDDAKTHFDVSGFGCDFFEVFHELLPLDFGAIFQR